MIKNKIPEKPKAVLLDWDNTLVDSWPVIHESLVETFNFMGKTPWTLEETKVKVHRSLRDSFPEVFGDDWQKAGDIYLRHFESIHLDRLTPLKDAEDTLKALLSKDIYLAIVSNKTGHNLRKEVTRLGWDKYFTKKIGAKDAPKDKPYLEPVSMALEGSDIKLSKKEVWFVGDSLTDLECAYNCNMLPVFYGTDDLTHSRYSHCQPELHFVNHKMFKSAISSWK